jgi:AraC-like DNA-binding protein
VSYPLAAALAVSPRATAYPSTSHPLMPPIMSFTGSPSRASRIAPRCAHHFRQRVGTTPAQYRRRFWRAAGQ